MKNIKQIRHNYDVFFDNGIDHHKLLNFDELYKFVSTIESEDCNEVCIYNYVNTNTNVAVKFIKIRKNLEACKREALMMKKVNEISANTVTYIGSFVVDKKNKKNKIKPMFTIVMELIHGINLFDYATRKNAYNLAIDKCFVNQLISWLFEMLMLFSNNNIVYKDFKLENIMINFTTKKFTLIDFGFSNTIDKINSDYVCGTPVYLAPELIKYWTSTKISPNFNKQDLEKSELWAIGIVIYEVLYNDIPWKNDSLPVLFHDIVYRNIKYDDSIVLKDYNDILKLILVKDVEQRLLLNDVWPQVRKLLP